MMYVCGYLCMMPYEGTYIFSIRCEGDKNVHFFRLKLITGQDSFILESVFRNTVFRTLDRWIVLYMYECIMYVS